MSKKTLLRRLTYEVSEMQSNPPSNCSAGPIGDNIQKWEGTIIGPKGSPFENGVFNLKINFPANYPFAPPEVKFDTPVYHPNINKGGAICLDILKDQWSPALSISTVLLSICSLLTDPNPSDPLEPEVARMYNENKLQYEVTARKWTEQYASGLSTVTTKDLDEEDDYDSDDSE